MSLSFVSFIAEICFFVDITETKLKLFNYVFLKKFKPEFKLKTPKAT